MSPIEIVRRREEEIRTNRFESAFAVDENGGVILDKPGGAFRVTSPRRTWSGFGPLGA